MLRSGRSYSGRERDCAFLNVGQRRFAAVAASMGVDLPDDSRALALVDWDQNGSLDMWITTRTSPAARFFKNTAPAEHGSLTLESGRQNVQPRRDRGTSRAGPRRSARQAADSHAPRGRRILGAIHQTDSFRPGDQPADQARRGPLARRRARDVSVAWTPIGVTSLSKARVSRWPTRRGMKCELAAKAVPTVPVSDRARIVVLRPGELPDVSYYDAQGEVQPLKKRYGKPLVLNLWATWCKPCLVELNEWAAARERLAERGVDVLDALRGRSGRESCPRPLSGLRRRQRT